MRRAIVLIAMSMITAAPMIVSAAERFAGYLIVGENVIITPDYLHPGDRVILSDSKGTVVFNAVLTARTLFSPLAIDDGLYRVQIERNDRQIMEKTVPVKTTQ